MFSKLISSDIKNISELNNREGTCFKFSFKKAHTSSLAKNLHDYQRHFRSKRLKIL